MTFWILWAVKCSLEKYSKPYGRTTAMSPAWGLIRIYLFFPVENQNFLTRNTMVFYNLHLYEFATNDHGTQVYANILYSAIIFTGDFICNYYL